MTTQNIFCEKGQWEVRERLMLMNYSSKWTLYPLCTRWQWNQKGFFNLTGWFASWALPDFLFFTLKMFFYLLLYNWLLSSLFSHKSDSYTSCTTDTTTNSSLLEMFELITLTMTPLHQFLQCNAMQQSLMLWFTHVKMSAVKIINTALLLPHAPRSIAPRRGAKFHSVF